MNPTKNVQGGPQMYVKTPLTTDKITFTKDARFFILISLPADLIFREMIKVPLPCPVCIYLAAMINDLQRD
jgi:hypothetical protein